MLFMTTKATVFKYVDVIMNIKKLQPRGKSEEEMTSSWDYYDVISFNVLMCFQYQLVWSKSPSMFSSTVEIGC